MKFKQTLSRFSIALALSAAVGIASLAVASQEKSAAKSASDQASADLLKVLEPYIGGEWHCTGSWNTGEKLVARETFTWSVGKKFVNVKTFVGAGADEYQRYDAMYGVKDGKLMSWSFAYDGTASTAEWKVDGKKWSTSNKQAMGGSEQVIHQTIELVEPDKFRWLLEVEKDGARTTMFDGFWVREGATAASAN